MGACGRFRDSGGCCRELLKKVTLRCPEATPTYYLRITRERGKGSSTSVSVFRGMSSIDPKRTGPGLLSQPGSKPFDLIAGTALGAVMKSRNAFAVAGSLAVTAAAAENVTLARKSGGIGTN